MKKRGKLVVIYGANNLGKSTQIALLENYLKGTDVTVVRVKYPVYDLEPTGPIINAVLRLGKKLPEDAVQKLYVQNRKDFEPQLKAWLEKGTWVIAEDYIGTGIAWGMVRGLDREFLEKINADLLPADVSILLYGKRFATGREANNKNENNDAIWQKAHDIHLELAQSYGWKKINANQSIEEVHDGIVSAIIQYTNKPINQ